VGDIQARDDAKMLKIESVQAGASGKRGCGDEAVGDAEARAQPVSQQQLVGGGELRGLRPNDFECGQESLNALQVSAVMATHHQFHRGHSGDGKRLRGDLFQPLLGRNCSA